MIHRALDIAIILAVAAMGMLSGAAIAQSMSNQGIGQANFERVFTARALTAVRSGDLTGAQDILNRCGSCTIRLGDLMKIAADGK